MMLNLLSVWISTIGFSIVFHVRRKHLLICGTVGAAGYAVYQIGENRGLSSVLSTFLAALLVTQLSYFLAKRLKTPITVFLITGILPLVPGLALYRTMYSLLIADYNASLGYAILTFEIAGAIAGAIVIISLFPLIWRKRKPSLRKEAR